MAQRPLRRRARGPVKLAGMCWVMTTGHENVEGRGVSTASSAGGPPVEVPIRTISSPVARAFVFSLPCAMHRSDATPPMRCWTWSRRRTLAFSLTPAAERTLPRNSGAKLPSATKRRLRASPRNPRHLDAAPQASFPRRRGSTTRPSPPDRDARS